MSKIKEQEIKLAGGNVEANKTRWFLCLGITELWNSSPRDIAGHRVQEAIRHTESKAAACASINLCQDDLGVGEQPKEMIPTPQASPGAAGGRIPDLDALLL